VLTLIQHGTFGDPNQFSIVLNPLWSGDDYYLVAQDFPSYIDAQHAIGKTKPHILQTHYKARLKGEEREGERKNL
jgi:hypothetical protein